MDLDMFFSTNTHDFKVGDLVEFEISAKSSFKNSPRWQNNMDEGGTGIWAKGKVTSITNENITVRYSIQGYVGFGYYDFPNYGNIHYNSWQWNRDGFLRKIVGVKCECGCESVYGQGTSCHSLWCPKYKEKKDQIEEIDFEL